MAFDLKKHATRELTGGDLLAQTLIHIGVEVAFGVHGGHLDAFLVGAANVGIKLVDTRHETAAVQAAEAYAKIKGKLGVCFVTANSGFSNGLPGLATALADRSPIFCITSSPPLRDQENNSLQAVHDQVIIAKTLTKFAHRITHPEDIPRLVAHAVSVAVAGAPGPVLIDFPVDVLFTPIQEKLISWGSISSAPAYKPGPSPQAIEKTLEILRASERPIIIPGTGASTSEASKLLLDFAGNAGIPIFQSPKFGALPYDHPNVAGLAELLPRSKTKPSAILLIGTRTGMYLGLRSGAILPHDAELIHVDTDGSEPGRTLPTTLSIASSSEEFLRSLLDSFGQRPFKAPVAWLNSAMALRNEASAHDEEPDYPTPGQMHPYKAIRKLFQSIPEGAILLSDGGESSQWTATLSPHNKPAMHVMTTGYMGFLGTGFGYAIGAAVAAPDKLIVNCQGDGSAGFHFMELDTFARFGLNILTVVINNVAWGMSKNGQELVYGQKDSSRPATSLADVKWEMVAEGLGVKATKITTLDAIQPAVEELFRLKDSGGPACINIAVSPMPIHPTTTAMVGMTEDPNMIVVPYYDNIPRAFYKI